MKKFHVPARIHTVEHREVEIDTGDMFTVLGREIRRSYGVSPDAYINPEGNWETWEDTPGSGITRTERRASENEKKVMESFKCLMSHVITMSRNPHG